jgi:YfiH family protein
MIINLITPAFKNILNISMLQTTRHGGFSEGNYESLNLCKDVNDNPDNVFKNFKLLDSICPNIHWITQVHGSNVIELPCSDRIGDSVFTKQRNVVCAIRTADCLPILLTNKKGSMVAAIHAGWRSLGSGIIEKTISEINSDSDIYAWLGPSISADRFIVGQDVYNFFEKNDPKIINSFIKYHDKYKLCLPTAAKCKLLNSGVKNIFGSTIDENFCTYDDVDRFFSYRRDKRTGRMASLIWINN